MTVNRAAIDIGHSDNGRVAMYRRNLAAETRVWYNRSASQTRRPTMITESAKATRRGRNVYAVNGVDMPATTQQAWTEAQLDALDFIASKPNFDFWVGLSMTPEEYATDWKRGPKPASYWTKDGGIVSIRVGVRGQLL